MKKFKRIVPFLLALIMALAIPLAACDSCGKKKEEEGKTLQSISLDSSSVRKEFAVGEPFTAEGLVVKASFVKDKSQQTEEVTLEAGDYKVDSSALDDRATGKHEIKVSYTYNEVTKDASYEVNVILDQDGLEVTLASGVESTYELSSTQPTVEIDTSKIVVKEINRDGSLSDAISDYSVKLYKGAEEVTLTSGKATVGGGAYAIWAEKESAVFPGYIRSAFVLIYVNDSLEKIELKSGVGTFEQDAGADVISKTWEFTATYASGATKVLKAADCVFEINTKAPGKDKTVQVSYTEADASGTVVTKSVEVKYTITLPEGSVTTKYEYSYAAIDNSELTADTKMTNEMLTGVNSFLKVGSGTATYRSKTKWKSGADIVEIKGEGLLVTFEGTGTITIGFGSTGASNTSSFGLKDSKGNYVAATAKTYEDPALADTYITTGTSVVEVTFEITAPGTYALVGAVNSAHDRNVRIHSIKMEDTVLGGASAAAVALDPSNQVYIVDKKVEQV